MSLTKYNKKRDFKKTKEPSGAKKSSSKSDKKQLIFTVQKHSASHLHYDFRLELDGVLKSWAVPKGPSLDPSVKRLAMMVEDHPFDYKDFEGIIPKGNYGAGQVIVWDNGYYIPVGGSDDKEENEKIMNKMMKKGDVKFALLGKKLKGEFALVNMHKDDNSWLMIKHNDEYASDEDLTKKDVSVLSKKTIESLKKAQAKEEGVEYDEEAEKKKAEGKKTAPKKQPKLKLLKTTEVGSKKKAVKKKAGKK
jgi:bifunctional non-homologous end joining protein LigD